MAELSFVLLLILIFTDVGNTDDNDKNAKRLLASDPNYIHQVEVDMQDLKAKINQLSGQVSSVVSQNADMTSKNAELTSKYTELTSKYSDVMLKNADLTSKYTDLTSQISELQATLAAANNSIIVLKSQVREINAGSVYIRWGRTDCPATAELVHAGYAGGSSPEDTGAAVNYLCMPKSPKWRPTPGKTSAAYVYGAEYESDFHSSMSIDDYEVPCSVCRTNRSSVLMFPATTDCLDGWMLEYEGDLATGSRYYKAASEYVCLDKYPQRASELGYNHDGKPFYPVGSKCGVLPCPPYVDGGQLSCAVCSK